MGVHLFGRRDYLRSLRGINLQKNGFIEKAKGVIMGHAVADALGLPVQFTGRKVLAQRILSGDTENIRITVTPKGVLRY